MNDTLTLSLFGDNIPLNLFATAIRHFNTLVAELTTEVAGVATAIQWDISKLHASSAIIQVRAQSDDLDAVERAIRGYNALSEALYHHDPIPFGRALQQPAYALTKLLNGRITGLAFTIDNAPVRNITSRITAEQVEQQAHWLTSWGTIRGEVGAIAKRPRLQFTLYDSLFDKAIACQLTQENEQIARSIWGKRIAVTGIVIRRADDGRPIRVRNITNIEVDDRPLGDFRRARGAIPWQHGDELPEDNIRRWRSVS